MTVKELIKALSDLEHMDSDVVIEIDRSIDIPKDDEWDNVAFAVTGVTDQTVYNDSVFLNVKYLEG